MDACSLLVGFVLDKYREYLVKREAQGSIVEDKENVSPRVNTESMN
jgi:hypothetical protein